MKAIIQRSGISTVAVNGEIVSEITKGLVILLGISNSDDESNIEELTSKIANLRLFESESKHFNKSVLEENLEILLVSQFTLYANCKKGRRPDFAEAAKSEAAKPLYDKFILSLEEKGVKVKTGVFGAEMEVSIKNQGPVTIILES